MCLQMLQIMSLIEHKWISSVKAWDPMGVDMKGATNVP